MSDTATKGEFDLIYCTWCRKGEHGECDVPGCHCAFLGHKNQDDLMTEGWKDIAELLAEDDLDDELRDMVKMLGLLFKTVEKNKIVADSLIEAGDAMFLFLNDGLRTPDERVRVLHAWQDARRSGINAFMPDA